MRFLIQVVNSASVEIVDKKVKNSIGKGLVVYVGISNQDIDDHKSKIDKFAKKIGSIRIFDDIDGKINKSLNEIGGEILIISNFTLYGKNKKGNKIDFLLSAGFESSKKIYELLIDNLQKNNYKIATGEFGENMIVNSSVSGPVNMILDL